jgi:hypothetical protein
VGARRRAASGGGLHPELLKDWISIVIGALALLAAFRSYIDSRVDSRTDVRVPPIASRVVGDSLAAHRREHHRR